MAKDEFYVGYLAKAPNKIGKLMQLTIIVLGVFLILIAFTITMNQKGFINSKFEFGKLVQVEGFLQTKPIPILRLKNGKGYDEKQHYQSIILVNFGKFGADHLINDSENKWVKLEGTLIYYDGVTLMELTNKGKSILEVKDVSDALKDESLAIVKNLGTVKIKGEIVDPKCYFGVMKPGFGKPHKSCAIRCIAGGIPPVLAALNAQGEKQYYILLGEQNQPINQDILQYVGDFVEIEGVLNKFDNWAFIQTSPINQIQRIRKGNILQ